MPRHVCQPLLRCSECSELRVRYSTVSRPGCSLLHSEALTCSLPPTFGSPCTDKTRPRVSIHPASGDYVTSAHLSSPLRALWSVSAGRKCSPSLRAPLSGPRQPGSTSSNARLCGKSQSLRKNTVIVLSLASVIIAGTGTHHTQHKYYTLQYTRSMLAPCSLHSGIKGMPSHHDQRLWKGTGKTPEWRWPSFDTEIVVVGGEGWRAHQSKQETMTMTTMTTTTTSIARPYPVLHHCR